MELPGIGVCKVERKRFIEGYSAAEGQKAKIRQSTKFMGNHKRVF